MCTESGRRSSWMLWSLVLMTSTMLTLGGCPLIISGPQGETGATGEQGPKGDTGATGEQGPPGETGQAGASIRGVDGAAGAPGEKGDQGDPGIDATVQAGVPVISSMTDATGGLLVVGDLLDLAGSNMDADQVLIGGKAAPIIAKSTTDLRVQIPAGVAAGTVQVQVLRNTGAGLGQDSRAIEVHRLAVLMGANNGKLVIVDTAKHQIVARIDRPIAAAPADVDPPYQLAFANQGSLAIVPTAGGEGSWIALTAVAGDGSVVPANGIVPLHDAQTPNDPATMTTIGAAVSPDGAIAVIADESRDQLYTLSIAEALPPYASPLAAPGTPLDLPENSGPRGPAFINDAAIAVACQLAGNITLVQRDPATQAIGLLTSAATGGSPTQLLFQPTMARLLTVTRTDARLTGYLAGGSQVNTAFATVANVADLYAATASGDGRFAYTIALNSNQVQALFLGDTAFGTIAAAMNPTTSGQARSIAVDPVKGDFLYVGLNTGDFVDVFSITSGGTLVRVDTPLKGDADLQRCLGIGFQQ